MIAYVIYIYIITERNLVYVFKIVIQYKERLYIIRNSCRYIHTQKTHAHTNTSPHDVFSKEILALMLGQMKNKPSLVLVLYVELCS